ncbi:MAG: nitrogenase-stabilizing/protective protein NifW [Actinomycetota bacterium]
MTVLDQLAQLSSAEQIFAALDVPLDQAVVDVSRLHILKRFRDLLAGTDLSSLPDDALHAVLRTALTQAQAEFASGTGAKTFKVFQQAKGFVGLGEVRR